MIIECETDGVCQLVGCKFHQLAGGKRHRRQAEYGRIVPTACRQVEGVDQPTVDLVSDDDGGDEVRSARVFGYGDRKTGRNIVARMAGPVPNIDVVQIVVAKSRTIGERRKIW